MTEENQSSNKVLPHFSGGISSNGLYADWRFKLITHMEALPDNLVEVYARYSKKPGDVPPDERKTETARKVKSTLVSSLRGEALKFACKATDPSLFGILSKLDSEYMKQIQATRLSSLVRLITGPIQ